MSAVALRRNAATSMERRSIGLDELRAIAGMVVKTLTTDVQTRQDLVQEGLIYAVKAREKAEGPVAAHDRFSWYTCSAFSTKVMHRGMLRGLEALRLNNRKDTYRPAPAFIAEVWESGDLEERTTERGFEAVENAMLIDAAIAAMPTQTAALFVVMRGEDCCPAEAGRRLGVSGTSASKGFRRGREYAQARFPEEVAA